MNREIKVTKCGEMETCEINDRISIELSPFEVTNLRWIFDARALAAKEYHEQGRERKMHDIFATARELWENVRGEKDK